MTAGAKNLVWIDLEMTGLDVTTCKIIEIAALITDSELNIIAEGPELVIHQPKEIMDAMDEWNTTHHGNSGLTKAVLESNLSLKEAEQQILTFIKTHCKENTAPLCGNSVWQDRRFLDVHMPTLEAYLHYRIIDVSSIKEVVRRWYPTHIRPPQKGNSHRALDDIRESIDELRYYRAHVFAPPGGSAKP